KLHSARPTAPAAPQGWVSVRGGTTSTPWPASTPPSRRKHRSRLPAPRGQRPGHPPRAPARGAQHAAPPLTATRPPPPPAAPPGAAGGSSQPRRGPVAATASDAPKSGPGATPIATSPSALIERRAGAGPAGGGGAGGATTAAARRTGGGVGNGSGRVV